MQGFCRLEGVGQNDTARSLQSDSPEVVTHKVNTELKYSEFLSCECVIILNLAENLVECHGQHAKTP